MRWDVCELKSWCFLMICRQQPGGGRSPWVAPWHMHCTTANSGNHCSQEACMAEAVEEKAPVAPVGMPMKMVLILVGGTLVSH